VTARYAASMIFYTDGSFKDGCEGFAFHRTGEGGLALGYLYCGVYCFVCDTATYWGGVSTPGEMLDFDSLSSVKALVSRKYRIGLICWITNVNK
jgi:hypothetical protein